MKRVWVMFAGIALVAPFQLAAQNDVQDIAPQVATPPAQSAADSAKPKKAKKPQEPLICRNDRCMTARQWQIADLQERIQVQQMQARRW
ncbi:hypothetical protein [Sphingomonas oryzagri]|uniref:Uncharacterized protein n=1 Tax=Sphingomonas oryzagri TaxID=3042314 RepID=A0ABT6MYX5_9SPHN|nr:hypothetical protein [Sphingomonas oryzagri]MDH7638038.1 hypothetical protein [Sphingomonas oryzagri]